MKKTKFDNDFSLKQIEHIEVILKECERLKVTDKRWLSYILATVYHETAKTMCPIEEYGKGRGKRYGRKVMYSGSPYSFPDKLYYGRGYPQLTWYENYKKYGEIFGLPLLEKPELMLVPEISAKVLIHGMVHGGFTGVSLKTYFNERTDWINARRIINVLDCAEIIAEHGKRFMKYL